MSGILICFTRRSETPTKEAYRILNRYDYIAKLWINGKSCAQLLFALPQVLTKSGPRRTATTLKKWVPAQGFLPCGGRWCCVFWEGEAPAEPNPLSGYWI
jgi:hypothetical protein